MSYTIMHVPKAFLLFLVLAHLSVHCLFLGTEESIASDQPGDLKSLFPGADLKRDPTGKLVGVDLTKCSLEVPTALERLSQVGPIQELIWNRSPVDDSVASDLARMASLKRLRLSKTLITDAGVEIIAKNLKLELFDISECDSVGEAGFVAISKIRSLKNLTIGGQSVSDQAIATLGQLENLVALSVIDSKVSDQGLRAFESTTSLKELSLVRIDAGDGIFTAFERNRSLSKLRIRGCRSLSSSCIQQKIGKFEKLNSLELSEAPLDDSALDGISELKKLTELNLLRTRVTSAGLEKIEALPLKKLNLDDIPGVNDSALPSILKLQNLEFLHLGKTKVTDRGAEQLDSLKSLRDLIVNDTAITMQTIDKLQASNPNLQVRAN